MNKKLWFKAKKYGWGWTPTTWQGWVVIAVYLVFLVEMFRSIDMQSHSGSDTLITFAPRFLIVTFFLYLVCYLKGEKPRWSWGTTPEEIEK